MKFLTCLLALLCATPLMAADVIIAISPYQAKEAVTQQLKWINEGISTLDGGSDVLIVDAETAREITQFSSPPKASQKHAKALMKRFKPHYGRVLHHIHKTHKAGHKMGSAHMPLLMNHVADYHPQAKALWLLISPIYDRAADQVFSMAGDKVSSDGAILARYPDVPYGTKGRKDTLKALRVHWWMPEPIEDDIYNLAVRDMWHSYLDVFGAKLITMSHDHNLVMRRVMNHSVALPLRHALQRDDKIYMIQMRSVAPELSMFLAPLSTAPLPMDTALTLSIGIAWAGPVDLDLHVRPAPNAAPIYFSNQNTPFGMHYKDIQSGSAQNRRQYETIDITKPVDLPTIKIAINYYGGTAPEGGITGTVRMAIAGKVYAMPFQFNAQEGNKGADIAQILKGGAASAHSLLFTPHDIIQNTMQEAAQ